MSYQPNCENNLENVEESFKKMPRFPSRCGRLPKFYGRPIPSVPEDVVGEIFFMKIRLLASM